MYYRVAIQRQADQLDGPPIWQWRSTVLSGLSSLLQWLQVYRAFSHERLRIFSSPLREALNAQLAWENQGLVSASVPAIQFLQERRIALQGAVKEASPRGTRADEPTAFLPANPRSLPTRAA